MVHIPRDRSLDSTLPFLREGHFFISNRCRRLGSDVFETRIMFRKVFCCLGREAAELFYDGYRLTRRGAMPKTTLKLLTDEGSVLILDDEAHRRRKAMFMSLMTPDGIGRLAAAMTQEWLARRRDWEAGGRVVLHREVQEILCRAVCRWAGVPLDAPDVRRRTRELAAMIEGAGAVGPRNWWGLLLRDRAERWARDIVAQVRAGTLDPPKGSALRAIARHRDADGTPLDTKAAGVELLNVLRPTVANARFIVFAALALHEHAGLRDRIAAGGDDLLRSFVQEVRRFYPFFIVVGGRVREDLDWRGNRFARGTWMILDIYGTNHDARIWGDPETFRPERFLQADETPYTLVAQGGGDHGTGHRCAGEWITIELMKTAVRLLTGSMRYEVPEQDLRMDPSRMPAIPHSRFVIGEVRSRTGDTRI